MRSQKDSALSAPIWPKEEERDVAKLDAVGVLGNDLEVERAHVEAHQVGDEVERLVLGQVRVLVAPVDLVVDPGAERAEGLGLVLLD